MNPIYKFELTAGETTQRAFPIYKDSLAIDFEKESGQEFFRRKLSGELIFESEDYAFIVGQVFDTQFQVEIFISYNAGQSWASYWKGAFWKTDCSFDEDAGTVTVKPSVLDQYNDILAGLNKEYDLIELAPVITPIKADKRPMVQVYVPGQSVIGCFLSGMWWEQECEAEDNESKLIEVGDDKLNFALNKTIIMADVSGTMTPELPDILTGVIIGSKFDGNTHGVQDFVNGDYTLRYQYQAGGGSAIQAWYIIRNSDSTILWENRNTGIPQLITLPLTITLTPVNGATGDVTLYIHEMSVYSRYICDVDQINGQPTFAIGYDDIVPDNRNYRRVIAYYFPDTIYFSTQLTSTPTQWGIYQPGQYYVQFLAPTYGINETFPVAHDAWVRVSIWFASPVFGALYERPARKQFTIKHTYPLWSVLQVLLSKIAPDIVFRARPNNSQFLYPYDANPITGWDFSLFITPKSNIVSAGYDQPAQKTPVTLQNIFEMLRDCFRCYWFVDENNLLHIEHVQYFRNGGTYEGPPSVGIDLTAQQVSRNGKSWAFAKNQYKFDKPAMAARYQFGWMDDVTQLFEGYPVDIVSKYVDQEKIEQVDIAKFTSDIDYVLLNPGAVSKDGFVLLAAIEESGEYVLPYVNVIDNYSDHFLQNAYVAFCLLQLYYAYDMPARNYEIKGVQKLAIGIKQLKTQSISFPLPHDPDLFELVRTDLGDGVIDKLSINLSSRNAKVTLRHDTE